MEDNFKAWAIVELFGASAIYAITPVAEEIARAVAERVFVAPVQAFELAALPSKFRDPPSLHRELRDDFDGDDGDDGPDDEYDGEDL